MLAKTSLVAICALSAGSYLLYDLKSPDPVASPPPAAREPRAQAPVRVLFAKPTRSPVARRLQKGEVHVYPLPLKAGEFVTIIAYQDGVDLKVTVLGADGKPFLTVDSPNGSTGPERVPFVTNRAATYSIEVFGASDRDAGPYRIWIATERPTTRKDQKDAAAEILFFQAKTKSSATENELKTAARLWKEAGNCLRRADALASLGQLYVNLFEWKRALPVWREAEALYHQAKAFGREGKLEVTIGTAYQSHSFSADAERSYDKALLHGRQGSNRRVVGAALYGLGNVRRDQGRSVEALEKLDQARKELQGLHSSDEIKSLTAMGEIFNDAGKPKAAMAKFQEALALAQDKNAMNRSYVLTGVASLYERLNEFELSRRYYFEALSLQKRTNNMMEMATNLNGIGTTYLNDKRPQEALDPFQKALDLFKRDDRPLDQARALTNLGWTYYVLGHESESRQSYESALVLARGRDAQVEAGAFFGLCLLEEKRGDPITAQKQAEDAIRSIEGMRAVVGRDLQISFFAKEQDAYNELVDILLWENRLYPSAGYDARALQISEQARSRSLLDRVWSFQSKADQQSQLPVPPVLSLSDIQRSILDPDTLLLEYHLGKSASYLWVVGKNYFHAVKLPPRQRIEYLARRVAGLLVSSARHERFREARQSAEDLSQVILGPASPWLEQKRLLISTPAILQSVPFGVLPDPQAPGARTRPDQWPIPLIEKHEIVRVPSASAVGAIRSRAAKRKRPPNRLAVIADPVSNNRDDRLARLSVVSPEMHSESVVDSLYGGFARLRYAEAEANAILSEAGSRGVWSASGFDATRELVLSGRLRDFQNLHFTMHGRFAEDDGNKSALVLSLWDRHGRFRDGFLRASEIYGLDLPADLVVLSACDTGRGENVPGEGVVGLPQAFMVAGATQVMMSLWSINDLATARLMKVFYHEYLAKGVSPAAALREAQREMLRSRDRNEPFYWGGFEIQGDWDHTSARR